MCGSSEPRSKRANFLNSTSTACRRDFVWGTRSPLFRPERMTLGSCSLRVSPRLPANYFKPRCVTRRIQHYYLKFISSALQGSNPTSLVLSWFLYSTCPLSLAELCSNCSLISFTAMAHRTYTSVRRNWNSSTEHKELLVVIFNAQEFFGRPAFTFQSWCHRTCCSKTYTTDSGRPSNYQCSSRTPAVASRGSDRSFRWF